MRRRILIIAFVWLLVDLYFFQAIRNLTPALYIHIAYWLIEGLLFSTVLYFVFSGRFSRLSVRAVNLLFGAVILLIIPKLLALPVLLLEDIFRVGKFGVEGIRALFASSASPVLFPGRNKFLSELTLALAGIPFVAIGYGITKGKYNYKVRRVNLKFRDLPDAFNGFTITQLSDIHAGSFHNRQELEKGIKMANAQQGDLLLFTGDFVNNKAEELLPWKDLFSTLSAPCGKFSVLGNHDYGDYVHWDSLQAKAANLQQLKELEKEMGFRLLLNEHVIIEKNGQSIVLAGVENWGKGGFQKYGDLDKALAGVAEDRFVVLMSHDPSHWKAQVLDYPRRIDLTLAGHTHGMQFGVEIGNFKWSPSGYIYPQWAGEYMHDRKYLYVNRGFGYLGFPGRVGIMPEITVITLEKG